MWDPEKLTICHVLLSRGFAGSERSTAESCNQQCVDNPVILILRDNHRRNGNSVVDHLDPRVTVRTVPARFFTARFIRRILREIRPDVIHCHLRRATRLVARLDPSAATLSTLHIGLNGPHFLRMDGLVCNARWQVESVPETFKGLVWKANNSLIPHRRLAKDEIARLRGEWGLDTGTLLVGGVGRYHPGKGWDTLIRAFRRLPREADARLIIFGAGRERRHLKSLAEGDSRIELAGFRKDIKDLYQAFDICVCPSRFEPLPRVILEAMDAGTPVIASDIGGCRELIEDYGGSTFRMDDVEDLGRLLKEALENRPERHRPDLSAHHLENTNRAMMDFYRKVIRNKRA